MEELKLTSKRKEIMETLNLVSYFEVVRYYPYRYEHLRLEPLSVLNIHQKITIEGPIVSEITNQYFSNKMMSSFYVNYDNNNIKVRMFNRKRWSTILKQGVSVVVTGKYNPLKDELICSSLTLGSLNQSEVFKPVYSLAKNIKPATFSSFIKAVYDYLNENDKINDHIPEDFIKKYQLITLKKALYDIHFPENGEDLRQANRYLKYEELLNFCMFGAVRKKINVSKNIKTIKNINYDILSQIIKQLPFVLTDDQTNVLNEILADLKSTKFMSRLLQGDVGCGKTIVALLALVANNSASYQGALMAPTDILARQHYKFIKEILANIDMEVALLVSDMQKKEKNLILEKLQNDNNLIVVGTHALIQEKIVFKNLGLAIIDEQHRFGVRQRLALKEKGNEIDILYMTATPIPRTLAATIYMDMDVSTISVFPFSQRKIITKYIKTNSLAALHQEIIDYVKDDNKVYIVCPAVNESKLEIKNVKKEFSNIIKEFPQLRVGLIYGKLSSQEKNDIMNKYNNNQLDILISTTVIEVGIDVKKANMMIILNAERFGLAQIHQLRGRIGRDGNVGYCYLLSDHDNDLINKRLEFMENTIDGFKVSEYDLLNRGPGDLLGTNQSGLTNLKIANLVEDFNILKCASADAKYILDHKKNYSEYVKYILKILYTVDNYIE